MIAELGVRGEVVCLSVVLNDVGCALDLIFDVVLLLEAVFSTKMEDNGSK